MNEIDIQRTFSQGAGITQLKFVIFSKNRFSGTTAMEYQMLRTFFLDVQGSVFEFKSWKTQVVNIHLPNVWQQVSRCHFYLSPDTNLVIVTFSWVQTQRISVFYVKLCYFSTNCIVWISLLKIPLPMYPHFLAF